MIKQAALALLLVLPLSACGQDDDNTRPAPTSTRIPRPGTDCQRVCKNLLGECGSADEVQSLALDDCSRECKANLFSPEEQTCLADLRCLEPSDACLED